MNIHFLKNRLHSPFKAIFDEARLLPDIRRSISMMVLGNIFGNLYVVITHGSALTGYAQTLGANDFVFGVLSGIPLAASLMQIPAAILVTRTQQRKKYMLTFGMVARALWILIGLIPFLLPIQPTGLRLWSVIFLIGLSSLSGSFINVSFIPWMADLIPLSIRGRWMSKRDGMIAIANIVFGLITASLLDHIPGYPGYAIVFVMGGTLGVLDMCCFIFVKSVNSSLPIKTSILKVAKQIFTDKPFFRFMLFWSAWGFTANMSGPFLLRYALGEMDLSFLQVTLSGQVASAVTTAIVITGWGRWLDRYGSKPVLWVSCLVAALTPGFFLFSVSGSVLPTLFHNVIGAAFWSAANLSASNMLLISSPDEQRPSYVAFFSSFTSLLGSFLGVLVGGAILEWIQTLSLDFARLPFVFSDRYKLIISLSIVLRFSIVLLFLPGLKNEKGMSVAGMFKDIANMRKY